jgi:hypothetical protein
MLFYDPYSEILKKNLNAKDSAILLVSNLNLNVPIYLSSEIFSSYD